jgi:two-component system response regulator DevR
MCDGLTNRQIGERLFIAESTVKRHVHSLLTKLRSETRLQAVLLAQRLWYLDQP